MNVLITIIGLLMIVVFGFSIAGTAGVHFRQSNSNSTTEILLYQQKFKGPSGTTVRVYTFKEQDFAGDCPEDYNRLHTTFIFGIVCIAFSAVVILCTLFLFCCKRWPKALLPACVFIDWLLLLITWAMSESIRQQRTCRQKNANLSSYRNQGFQISYGLALFISAWCICGVALGLSIYIWRGVRSGCGFNFKDDHQNIDDNVRQKSPPLDNGPLSYADTNLPTARAHSLTNPTTTTVTTNNAPFSNLQWDKDQKDEIGSIHLFNTRSSLSPQSERMHDRDSSLYPLQGMPFGVVVGGVLMAPLATDASQNYQQNPFAAHSPSQINNSGFRGVFAHASPCEGEHLNSSPRPLPPTVQNYVA